MRRTTPALIIVTALFFSGVISSPKIGLVSGQTVVTIFAEGTISPTFAPIQRDGEVYTLIDDVGALVIERSGIVLDGNGHTITGTFEEKKVHLPYVKNVTLKNLVIEGGAYGIVLDHTSNVTLTNNIVKEISVPFPASQGTAGIYVYGGVNNTIVRNHLENNVKGIVLVSTFERNIVSENNITGNYMGMVFWNASNNVIYHNNFINSTLQAWDSGEDSIQANMTPSLNSWDKGYPYGGNFWSDYQKAYPNAVEIDGSGIGNPSYVIDSQNRDWYPLMEPFTTATYLLQTTPPEISVVSPLNQTYPNSNVSLIYTVDRIIDWTAYSLDGKDNETIAGNITLTGLSSGMHAIIVYANDTFGNMGASEILVFTISTPFPVMPLAAAIAVVAVVGACLLLYRGKRQREAAHA